MKRTKEIKEEERRHRIKGKTYGRRWRKRLKDGFSLCEKKTQKETAQAIWKMGEPTT